MTRQQYIAELHSLLGFMSDEDRQRTIDKYIRMFNKAADEEEFMARIGTPTRVAIKLAGEYVPSTPEQRAEEDEERRLFEAQSTLFEGGNVTAQEADAIAAAETESESAEAENAAEEADEIAASEEEIEEPAGKTRRVRGGVLAVYILLSIVIGFPITIALVLVGLAVAAPGVGIGVAVYNALPQIIAPLSLFSDMALAAGAALIVCSLALMIVWFGLWLSITLAKLWIGGAIFGLGSKICVKEVAEQ